MNWRPIWNGERVCATNGIQWRRHNQRRTNEATCAWRKPHGPHSNCRRPSVHQLKARQKTPVHAHDANNHTMNTTGTCNPQKLRCHEFTWKPSTTGEHPTPTKQPICYNSSDAAQKTRTRKLFWSTSPHIKSNVLCLGKHIFVTSEIRPLPKTHRTRNMRHMRQTKRQRQHFAEDEHSSLHTCTSTICERTCASCSSWPRAALRKTQETGTSDTNDARGHHAQSITTPHRVKQLESFEATRSTK